MIMKNAKAAGEATDCWGGEHDGTHELGNPTLISGKQQSYGAVTTDSY